MNKCEGCLSGYRVTHGVFCFKYGVKLKYQRHEQEITHHLHSEMAMVLKPGINRYMWCRGKVKGYCRTCVYVEDKVNTRVYGKSGEIITSSKGSCTEFKEAVLVQESNDNENNQKHKTKTIQKEG